MTTNHGIFFSPVSWMRNFVWRMTDDSGRRRTPDFVWRMTHDREETGMEYCLAGYLFVITSIQYKMIKLLDTLNEEQNYDRLVDLLYTIDNERFKVTDVDIVDKEKYVIIGFNLILKELTPDTFNIFYGTTAEMILNAGYTTNLESVALAVNYFTVDHESGLSVEGIRILPREIYNRLKYDLPPVSSILKSQYSLVIPKSSTMEITDEFNAIVNAKKKKSVVYYSLYKKGKVGEIEYELSDTPKIKLVSKGGATNSFNPVNIIPEIQTTVKTIDGISPEDKNYPHHLLVKISDSLKEKFKKQDIDIDIFD